MTHPPLNAPLSGIRIIDLSRVLAGPWCSQLLADLGAEVIKIEHPETGDETRHWGPPDIDSSRSAYFVCANRGKENRLIDFTEPEQHSDLLALIADADVLIENFLPGKLATYGLDYDTLSQANPGLVYCSITGYGQTGPNRDRPGYDTLIQAETGLMSLTGPVNEAQGYGYKTGVAVSDLQTGLYAANAIQAALLGRERHGQGCHLDLALFDVQMACLGNVASAWLASEKNPVRHGNAHASIAPYEPFDTLDGHVMLAIGNDRQFQAWCNLANNRLYRQAEYASNRQRVQHRETLVEAMQAVMSTRSSEDWLSGCRTAGIPCAPINRVEAAMASDQVAARELITERDGIRMMANPIRINGEQVLADRAPPGHDRLDRINSRDN